MLRSVYPHNLPVIFFNPTSFRLTIIKGYNCENIVPSNGNTSCHHHHSCPSTRSRMSVKLCPANAMAMSLAVVRSWGEQVVFIMGQTSRCCMVCLVPQSQVSGSVENPHFNMLTLDRPTCARNRLSAFQVVQGFSAPAGRCSSALMSRCNSSVQGLESFSP